MNFEKKWLCCCKKKFRTFFTYRLNPFSWSENQWIFKQRIFLEIMLSDGLNWSSYIDKMFFFNLHFKWNKTNKQPSTSNRAFISISAYITRSNVSVYIISTYSEMFLFVMYLEYTTTYRTQFATHIFKTTKNSSS